VTELGTAYLSGALEFTPVFYWGSCYSTFSFMCMICRSLFVFLFFFFWPLCCLFRFTDSNYPFGIFKLFFSLSVKIRQGVGIRYTSLCTFYCNTSSVNPSSVNRVGTFEVIFTLLCLFTLYVNIFYRKKYCRQKSGDKKHLEFMALMSYHIRKSRSELSRNTKSNRGGSRRWFK